MAMEKKPLSLLSYNLYCLPWLACLTKPSTCPYSYDRTTEFLKRIPEFDIIGLQEVWSPRYQQVESYAKYKGWHVVGSAQAPLQSMLGLRLFGGGLMIMSKYPIETTRELVFDKGVASDGFVRKGVLYAKVKIGDSYVHVFNTHMQASYGYEFVENDPYALIRKEQIEKLSTFIAKIVDDHHPIVAMGDFNVNAIRHPHSPGTDSKEYLDMVLSLGKNGLFNVVDLHKGFNGGAHPVTNTGLGVVGTKVSKGGQRLDFMLEMRRSTTRMDRIYHSFTHAAVLPFAVSDAAYTHISDHFASHVVMEIPKQDGLEEDGADIRPKRSLTIQLTA